jgi:hypothetical protein
LWDGDALVAVVRYRQGEPMPAALTLTGDVDGARCRSRCRSAGAVDTAGVAQRWAVHHLSPPSRRDRAAGFVQGQQDYGVLSRHTSLLVLESDGAYKSPRIERRRGGAAGPGHPTVTGGDLDSLGARQAASAPTRSARRSGIKIGARRRPLGAGDLPVGRDQVATWDRDVDAWMVRFLIDLDTPDGDYQARVAVTHADGRVEVLHLSYRRHHRAAVKLSAVRTAAGYEITARQIASGGSALADADRVEVVLPDGQMLQLAMTQWGQVRGRVDHHSGGGAGDPCGWWCATTPSTRRRRSW